MDYIEKLQEAIRLKNKQYGLEESDVMYLHNSTKISVDEFTDLKPYSARQSSYNGKVNIAFSKHPYQITFTNAVTERIEDRESFEKYKGLIYLYIPMNQEHAKIFLNVINKY